MHVPETHLAGGRVPSSAAPSPFVLAETRATESNMFEPGRRFAANTEPPDQDHQPLDGDAGQSVVDMLKGMGLSKADAISLANNLDVVNIAWEVARKALTGERVHEWATSEREDLACVVEDRLVVEKNDLRISVPGYPATHKLTSLHRACVYLAYDLQGRVNSVVVRTLFDQLARAAALSSASDEVLEDIWVDTMLLQPTCCEELVRRPPGWVREGITS